MKFIYWSNKTTYHEAKLFEIETDKLSEADAAFKENTGLDAAKTNWVSMAIGGRSTLQTYNSFY